MTSTRPRLRRALPVLVLATAVLLGACSSDDKGGDGGGGADGADDASSAKPELSDAALEAYFEAVASYDPEQLASAREVTEPGSNADLYAAYLGAFSTAAIEGGSPIDASEVESVEGGFKACGGTGDPASCVTWADLEVVDGALIDFTVNGQSLDERLVAGDGSATGVGDVASAELLYAYQSPQSGTQFVAVLVSSEGTSVRIDGDGATYHGPDGSGYTSAGAWGATSVDDGGSATVVLPFENAPTGGTVNLMLSSDDVAAPVEVTIDTAP